MTVAMPGGGGILSKRFTVMSGGFIPAIKVKLRTISRVNPTMTGFRPALSYLYMLVVLTVFRELPEQARIRNTTFSTLTS